jgi:hypothetical protein
MRVERGLGAGIARGGVQGRAVAGVKGAHAKDREPGRSECER